MGFFQKLKTYLHNFAVAEDQAANVLVTNGKPDETISSHAQRAADKGNWLGKGMTKFLHLFQKDHGHKAEAGDLRRAEDVVKTEKEALGEK